MTIILIFLACMLVAATITPLIRSRKWYFRAMDFPRFQILVLAIGWYLVWVLTGLTGDSVLGLTAFAVAGVIFYQALWILPYTQTTAVEVDSHSTSSKDQTLGYIRILSANVLMTNRHTERLLAHVHHYQPDILITLESDHWWQEQLDTLDEYTYRIPCPLDNFYGMHVYSRLPLDHVQIDYRVESDKPSMYMQVCVNESHWVTLYVLHPAPPSPSENEESTERDIELISVAKEVSHRPGPIIIAGDLNDVAWSATTRLFKQISGLLDPRIGRGLYNTFSANLWFARWPLDHIFISRHFRLVKLERLPKIGSDHFPLFVELALIDAHSTSNGPSKDTVTGFIKAQNKTTPDNINLRDSDLMEEIKAADKNNIIQ